MRTNLVSAPAFGCSSDGCATSVPAGRGDRVQPARLRAVFCNHRPPTITPQTPTPLQIAPLGADGHVPSTDNPWHVLRCLVTLARLQESPSGTNIGASASIPPCLGAGSGCPHHPKASPGPRSHLRSTLWPWCRAPCWRHSQISPPQGLLHQPGAEEPAEGPVPCSRPGFGEGPAATG